VQAGSRLVSSFFTHHFLAINLRNSDVSTAKIEALLKPWVFKRNKAKFTALSMIAQIGDFDLNLNFQLKPPVPERESESERESEWEKERE